MIEAVVLSRFYAKLASILISKMLWNQFSENWKSILCKNKKIGHQERCDHRD